MKNKPQLIILIIMSLITHATSTLAGEAVLPLRAAQQLKETSFLQALPLSEDSFVLLSPQNLYRLDKDRKAERIFRLQGDDQLKRVAYYRHSLFLATDKGVYRNRDLSGRWDEIWTPRGASGERPVTVEIGSGAIFLGTTQGLYISPLKKITLKKVDNFPKDETPLEIRIVSPSVYFVMTDRSLWKTRDGGMSFEKLLGDIPRSKESALTEDPEEEGKVPLEGPATEGHFTSLAASADGNAVWVGTEHGIFRSEKGGLQFEKLSSSGLASEFITRLLVTPLGITAATQKGVYRFQKDGGWKNLNDSLSSRSVKDMALQDKTLWVAAEDGVFSVTLPSLEIEGGLSQELHFDLDSFRELETLARKEPSVREVQKAAIRYSNTRNGKIQAWQILSHLRALAPSVGYTIGKSRSSSVDLDRGGTNDPDIYIAGPESWDKDRDISVRWDLGDFLFSPAQTSIDSRDKLMVELRDEIVSEVTRLYFERRRLQMDLLFERPEGKKLLGSWIRIEELTAQIDGLTGGYFSKKLKSSPSLLSRELSEAVRKLH